MKRARRALRVRAGAHPGTDEVGGRPGAGGREANRAPSALDTRDRHGGSSIPGRRRHLDEDSPVAASPRCVAPQVGPRPERYCGRKSLPAFGAPGCAMTEVVDPFEHRKPARSTRWRGPLRLRTLSHGQSSPRPSRASSGRRPPADTFPSAVLPAAPRSPTRNPPPGGTQPSRPAPR